MTPEEKQLKLNEHHAFNPKLGDYWHKALGPVLVVVEVDSSRVIICTKKLDQELDQGCPSKVFDLSECKVLSIAAFSQFLSCWGARWADVKPEALKTIVETYLEQVEPTEQLVSGN